MKTPTDKESVIARFIEGPKLLERTVAGLNEAELDAAPSNGGWTIRQIVHHVVDGDDIWKMGIKQALGDDGSEFSLDWYRALPQDAWADRWSYAERPVDVSLAMLKAARDHVVQLLEHVADAWNKSVRLCGPDGEVEIVPVGFVIEMQADHVEHHVKRILAIRSELEVA